MWTRLRAAHRQAEASVLVVVVLTAGVFACALGIMLWLHLGARRGTRRSAAIRSTALVAVGALSLVHLAIELLVGLGHAWPSLIHLACCTIAVILVLAMTRLPRVRPATREDVVVLAVGAHPDDLELACGGTLRSFADAGVPVAAVVMSSGGLGGDAGGRRDEARTRAEILGVASLLHLDHPDRALGSVGERMIADLERVIEQVGPTLILTHSANDQHQDHVAVHEAVLRAARRESSILCFESPSATRGFAPTVYVDIARQLEAKELAIAAHADQADKPYMASTRARATAAFRGAQDRIASAEAFEVERYLLPVLRTTGRAGAASAQAQDELTSRAAWSSAAALDAIRVTVGSRATS